MIQRRTARPARQGGGEIIIPPGGRTLEEIERVAVRITLQLTHGNQSEAARLLVISRPTLTRKMRDAGLAQPAPGGTDA